ncbi:COX15/CtaA family protein [Allokutzneria sp. A3M-2-11 16]|uniref:COX15/CtaA family protein n=1 Tax=Allokutzneria sp. A3M-2-11 16 TaxID=2962043 RepID=UPI0020B65CAD|nr:COX15/CtaA family protein [Allokutzneria sp. A3M-2-11 16]MCP3803570.1 COX15/CtaA family protein [Allokutzneria sp. A3M-2-11 16]
MPGSGSATPLLRVAAIVNVVMQSIIAVTGSVVRVTGSGLGCPTWPNCQPGSLVPVPHPEFDQVQQWIEFGNRLLSGLVGVVALACLYLAWKRRPRGTRQVRLAVIVLVGVLAQGVVGGIVVLLGLVWWTVAFHLLVSMALVWASVLFLHSVVEGVEGEYRSLVPGSLRKLLIVATAALAVVLVLGTMVTGAGPHAGDPETPRLNLPIAPLAQFHADALFLFLGMLIALGFALHSTGWTRLMRRWYWVLVATVLAQGSLGMVQYWTGVPETLVSFHVLGAAAVTAVMAGLWTMCGERVPVQRDQAAELPNEPRRKTPATTL